MDQPLESHALACHRRWCVRAIARIVLSITLLVSYKTLIRLLLFYGSTVSNSVFRFEDSASQIVQTIWPLSVVSLKSDSAGSKAVLPLRIFIQETLRRSRTSYSTLQVALYYLILIKNCVPRIDFTMEQPRDPACPRAMQCGRRMFLAALILASKYLQDRNYSARAWSKISGLSTAEINQNEWAFLEAVNWKLHIAEPVFQRWSDIVLKYTPKPGDSSNGEGLRWSAIIPKLNPELDNIEYRGRQRHFNSPGREMFVPAKGPASLHHVSLPERPARPSRVASDQAPTFHIPSTLEPNPCMNVTLPSLQNMHLPTPQMTPQPNNACTPAVSVGGFASRRPSIGAAMSQAQAMSVQRAAVDRRPSMCYSSQNFLDSYSLSRRSSLARSASSSSPESMVSDVSSLPSSLSSRSSRSSSISSVASGTCAPVRPRLVRRATRQSARSQPNCLKESRKTLSIATPINEDDSSEICMSPPPYTSCLPRVNGSSNWSLETFDTHEAARGLCQLSCAPTPTPTTSSFSSLSHGSEPSPGPQSRKRGRTDSQDFGLQHTVRNLMAMKERKIEDDRTVVVADNQVADSIILSEPETFKAPLSFSNCGGEEAAQQLSMLRYSIDVAREYIKY